MPLPARLMPAKREDVANSTAMTRFRTSGSRWNYRRKRPPWFRVATGDPSRMPRGNRFGIRCQLGVAEFWEDRENREAVMPMKSRQVY